jgi:hypothetical protein
MHHELDSVEAASASLTRFVGARATKPDGDTTPAHLIPSILDRKHKAKVEAVLAESDPEKAAANGVLDFSGDTEFRAATALERGEEYA